MKVQRHPLVRPILWLILAAFSTILPPVGISRPVLVAADETAVLYEWPTSGQPLHPTLLSDRLVYFTEGPGETPRIGELDIVHNVLREWMLAPGRLHGIAPFHDGVVFGYGADRIALLNPKTNVLRTWKIPTSNAVAVHVISFGDVDYFTENAGDNIGRLNLRTNEFTEWPLSHGLAFDNGIDVAGNNIFFTEYDTRTLAMLDATSNTLVEWPVPSGSSPTHVSTAGPFVFFGGFDANTIGRLDPRSNLITEWPIPTPASQVDGITASQPDLVFFTENAGNRIGRLETAAQPGADSVVIPMVTAVTPTHGIVTPIATTLTPVTSTVTPDIQTISGVRIGGFVEWELPTASSLPLGIWSVRGTGVVICENNARKIGLLR